MMKFLKGITIKRTLLIASVVLMASCKSAKVVTGGTVDEKLSVKSVIKAHYQNQAKFKTLN